MRPPLDGQLHGITQMGRPPRDLAAADGALYGHVHLDTDGRDGSLTVYVRIGELVLGVVLDAASGQRIREAFAAGEM